MKHGQKQGKITYSLGNLQHSQTLVNHFLVRQPIDESELQKSTKHHDHAHPNPYINGLKEQGETELRYRTEKSKLTINSEL